LGVKPARGDLARGFRSSACPDPSAKHEAGKISCTQDGKTRGIKSGSRGENKKGALHIAGVLQKSHAVERPELKAGDRIEMKRTSTNATEGWGA